MNKKVFFNFKNLKKKIKIKNESLNFKTNY